MSLKLNADAARKADQFSSVIRETGKYVGVITRAEKLESSKGTTGLGISFDSDSGGSASYLDVYTHKADGEELWGANIVQSILCCTKTKDAAEGPIKCKKWDKASHSMVDATVTGYPSLMGKRIGLILQKELATNDQTGADTERMNIVGVFEAATGLTSSEILDGKTKPERADQKLKSLSPVYDRRKNKSAAPLKVVGTETVPDWVDDDLKDIKF